MNNDQKKDFQIDFKNYESMDNNDPLKVYDLIVQIESIKSLFEEGWKIKATNYGKKNFDKYQLSGSVVVTAIGNKNKGKSFILNKILEKEIPRGFSVTTEGLSIIYPKNRPVIVLDTCGSESPLLELDDYNIYKLKINGNDEENKKYEEKKKYI